MGRNSLARRCLAEALAAFALVFAGCGAILLDHERDWSLGAVGIAASFGLVSFGPALVSSTWSGFWIYVAGPIAGAVVGALAYQFVREPPEPDSRVTILR